MKGRKTLRRSLWDRSSVYCFSKFNSVKYPTSATACLSTRALFFVVLFCFLNHSSNSNILSATQNPTYAALWRRAIVVSLTRSPVSDMQWVQTVCWFLESLCPWCRPSPSGLGIVASLTATLPSGVFASTGQLLTKQNWEVTVRRPNPGHASFRKRKDGVPVSRPESTLLLAVALAWALNLPAVQQAHNEEGTKQEITDPLLPRILSS